MISIAMKSKLKLLDISILSELNTPSDKSLSLMLLNLITFVICKNKK